MARDPGFEFRLQPEFSGDDSIEEKGVTLEQNDIERLSRGVNFAAMTDPGNVETLGHLSKPEREEFAFKTKSVVLYIGAEVSDCRRAEEEAALRAAPAGHAVEDLNGLNVGCGDRLISPFLTAIDVMRCLPARSVGGEHHALNPGSFLALADDLPFCPTASTLSLRYTRWSTWAIQWRLSCTGSAS